MQSQSQQTSIDNRHAILSCSIPVIVSSDIKRSEWQCYSNMTLWLETKSDIFAVSSSTSAMCNHKHQSIIDMLFYHAQYQ